MNDNEKMMLIADVLEMEPEEIHEADELANYDTWDSIAVLSIISIMNDEFNRFPNADEILSYITVRDLMNAMQ